MVCEPAKSDEVVNDAAPPARVPFPMVAAPSRNVTVPVIVPAVAEVTVAVNVTFVPVVDGLSDDARTVVVEAFAAPFTTCVSTGEVLAAKFASPRYCAVIEREPAASVEVVKVAVPAASVPFPMVVAPSKNVTEPVIVPAVAEVTVAVKVTFAPVVDGFSDDVTALVVAARPGCTAPTSFSSTVPPAIRSGTPSLFKSTGTAPPPTAKTIC